jgi:hypothetical protein
LVALPEQNDWSSAQSKDIDAYENPSLTLDLEQQQLRLGLDEFLTQPALAACELDYTRRQDDPQARNTPPIWKLEPGSIVHRARRRDEVKFAINGNGSASRLWLLEFRIANLWLRFLYQLSKFDDFGVPDTQRLIPFVDQVFRLALLHVG